MKKTTLFKTIVLAAAMMLGSEAWATPTTTILYNWSTSGTGVDGDDEEPTIWNATELATWADPNSTGGSFNISSNSLGLGFGTGGGNGSVYSRSRSFTIDGTAILTYDFVWYVYADYTNVERCFLNIGSNIELMAYPSTPANSYVKFNSIETKFKTAPTITDHAATLTVHLVVNTVSREVTAFTIKQGETTLISLADLSDSQTTLSDGTSFSTIGLQAKTRANGHYVNSRLTSAKIQQTTQDIATYSYTVNYKDGDNIVKTVSGSLAEGALIPVLSALDGEGVYSGQHYLISASTVPTQNIVTDEASNVLDVAVRKPYKVKVQVAHRIAGSVGNGKLIYTQDLTESDDKDNSYTYVFPYCWIPEGETQWHIATLVDGKFGAQGTYTDNNYTSDASTIEVKRIIIDYTLDEDIVFYGESGTRGSDITYSNGGGQSSYIKTSSDPFIITSAIPKGFYQLKTGKFGNDNKAKLKNGEDVVAELSSAGTMTTFTMTEGVEESTLKIYSNSKNITGFDYVLIRKIPVNISAVDNLGYTFSSTLPLDFTGTDVEAYTAAYNSTSQKVELTRVYKVPANTGLFIKGSADDIPVLTGAADVISTNNLVAVSATTTVNQTDGGDNTNFVLGLVSAVPTFLKVPSAGVSVGAGKAYLQIPTASVPATARMAVVFNDEVTGISQIENGELRMEDSVYNLSGQRVAQPKKGLYIVNGKKVMVK